MRVLITTDLDRTLIFSRRAIDELGGPLPASLVDDAGGRGVGLANDVRDALLELRCAAIVVPTTTRTPEQLNRIAFPFTGRWSIASNGAVVLNEGAPDPEWAVSHEPAAREVIAAVAMVREAAANGALVERHYEPSGAYVCAVTPTESAAIDIGAQLQGRCEKMGWRAVPTGRKLYLLPANLDKSAATHFVRERVVAASGGGVVHLAAGDSILDAAMLEMADLAWVPRSSSLDNDELGDTTRVTTEPGHRAARQITADWMHIVYRRCSTSSRPAAQQT